MHIKLRFLGAAQNVTGSRYLVETNNTRFLVDCGLYQERDFTKRNWDPFPVPPDTIDAVLLTHTHLDHCGLIPKLVREGFHGKIYCTSATADIARIILMDSARLQEEDAEFKRKRHRRERRKSRYPEVPLYTSEDAKSSFPLFSAVNYKDPVHIGNDVEATFYDAGHVLGSAMIRVTVKQGKESRTILFSGDVGRPDRPILQDPNIISKADYLVIESTYGDRVHEDTVDIADRLAEIINSTHRAGGNIVVPSFALQRTQEVLYYLNDLLIEDRIPHMLVFLDSPMAISITEVFKHHSGLFDSEMIERLNHKKSPFDFPGLKMVQTADESKSINHISGTIMIIAGSGMCTGGRIKHHLVTNISRRKSTILFVGYQAGGTLGRQIIEGARRVRILGQKYPVRARIAQLHGFSAHADRDDILRWLSGLKNSPKHIFVTHGEANAAHNFRDFLAGKTGWKVSVPAYEETAILD